MGTELDGTTRINLDLDRELYVRYINTFPHGVKSQVLRNLIEMAVDAVDEVGPLMIGAIITGSLTLAYKPKKENLEDMTSKFDAASSGEEADAKD